MAAKQARGRSRLLLLLPLLLLFLLAAIRAFTTRRRPGAPPRDLPAFLRALEEGRPQNVVFYGTSLTDGQPWVAAVAEALEERYPGLPRVENAAKSGMWSGWGLENWKSRVAVHSPDAVFIEFAINDAYLALNTSVQLARWNLEDMIALAWSAQKPAEVILMTMNQPIGEALRDRPRVEAYYDMYRQTARDDGLLLIDHERNWKRLWGRDRDEWRRLVPDGLHPGEEGQRRVVLPEMLRRLGLVDGLDELPAAQGGSAPLDGELRAVE
ncbi:SGNH hydrolase-type esterase domain-containing protein [Hyaloraphidium curvatum]|nr:SGNH hydrolase-type esterase domain-containing protein [Hyaloraphidium curvatum]